MPARDGPDSVAHISIGLVKLSVHIHLFYGTAANTAEEGEHGGGYAAPSVSARMATPLQTISSCPGLTPPPYLASRDRITHPRREIAEAQIQDQRDVLGAHQDWAPKSAVTPLRRAPPASAVRTPSPASRLRAVARIQSRGVVEHLRVEAYLLVSQLVAAGACSVCVPAAKTALPSADEMWRALIREREGEIRCGLRERHRTRGGAGGDVAGLVRETEALGDAADDSARGGAGLPLAEELTDKGRTRTMKRQVLEIYKSRSRTHRGAVYARDHHPRRRTAPPSRARACPLTEPAQRARALGVHAAHPRNAPPSVDSVSAERSLLAHPQSAPALTDSRAPGGQRGASGA
ncbi:hypothetical protein FB451DRAFT_1572076 [Mycena latifolia]|nr:hypothetical protein FB451DRAFT_1572076 [Mycena latifolia]